MAQDSGAPAMPPLLIVLGGTGVIGTALRGACRDLGLDLLSLSLDPDATGPGYRNRRIDLHAARPGALADELSALVPAGHRVHALLDVVGLKPPQIAEAAPWAAGRGIAWGQVSSCLLYDHDHSGPVDETAPLVSTTASLFPYQSMKLAQEQALRANPTLDWRIFRTNHVIGRGGLLGCIPDHNRDPDLLDRLHGASPLSLAAGGQVRLSWIHAADLANAMVTLCALPQTARSAMNIVHPAPVLARTYYEVLADLIGAPPPRIVPVDPDPAAFWSVTGRDNVFVSAMPEVARLNFRHDLRSALGDALAVGAAAYRLLGGFMGQRISGR